MFSLCFSRSKFLINLRWQFRVRKIFRTQGFARFAVILCLKLLFRKWKLFKGFLRSLDYKIQEVLVYLEGEIFRNDLLIPVYFYLQLSTKIFIILSAITVLHFPASSELYDPWWEYCMFPFLGTFKQAKLKNHTLWKFYTWDGCETFVTNVTK